MKIDYSWVSGLIIINPINKKMFSQISIRDNGQYDGIDIVYEKSNGRYYAPIIEHKGEIYTEEEYHNSPL